MEWHLALLKGANITKRINAYFFDHFAARVSRGAIVISDYIYFKLASQKKNNKIIYIPVLTDIEKIDENDNSVNLGYKYFLYCGNIGYYDVVNLILDAYFVYRSLNPSYKEHLILVLSGENKLIDNFRSSIDAYVLSKDVNILSNIDYNILISLYKNSELLLIPLRESEQDKARYPQKIAEYSASGVPIVSNKVGQVGKEFSHKEDIYFADDFSSKSIAKAIQELMNDSELRNKIANKAKEKCLNLFDYKNYILKSREFIENL